MSKSRSPPLVEDAEAISEAARAAGLPVACGFLERAFLPAIGLDRVAEAPSRIEAVRRGPPSPRCLDVSVVVDLMIHDLDLALCLSRGEAVTVEAEGARIANALLDEARAEAIFSDGLVATFEASRVADERRRSWRIAFPSGTVEIDLIAHRLIGGEALGLEPGFGDAAMVRDRLGESVDAFLAAVRGEGAPLADAEAGIRALDLALAVERAAEEG